MTASNPYDKAHELARAIKETEIYERYVAAQKQMEQNPTAQEKILSFRKLQMEVNQAQILGQQLPNDKVSELSVEYAKLNRDKSIAEFFEAEGIFMQMFTEIHQIIQKGVGSGFVV